MIYPKFLKEGMTIDVPAPSNGASDEPRKNRQRNSKLTFEKLGFNVIQSKNINNSYLHRSADKKVRAEEINAMFKSKDIDYIICASGGEYLVECLPYVDFDLLVNNPKFVQGFSDPTGLLFTITTNYDIATIYGTNAGEFGMEDWHQNVKNSFEIMKGNLVEQESFDMYANSYKEYVTGLESYNLDTEDIWKTLDGKDVKVKGRLIGGCFDIIAELAGTKYDGMKKFNEKYKEDGIILYFDNCELSYEETIRVLWKLNELEYFKYASGIIFGRFGTENNEGDYKSVKECLEDSILKELNIPVIYDADISHKDPCMTIINGAIGEIEVKNGKGIIKQELK